MIPKKIHYCWFGGKPLPSAVKQCIATWEKYCPDFEITQWNESNFDINCHPFVRRAYEVKAWAFVSDYARLKVVYDNGGIYFDTDVELLKSVESLIYNECYIGVQQYGHQCTTGLGFGASKFNPIVLEMMKQYDGLVYQEENKAKLACPYLNAKVFTDLGYTYSTEVQKVPGATIFPPRFFDPLAPGDNLENLLCDETISIHHYSASWTSKTTRAKRSIIRLIGQERVMKIKRFLKYGK